MFTRIVENRRLSSYASLFTLAFLITACGGGSDDHTPLDQTSIAKQTDLNFDRIDSSESRADRTESEQRQAFNERQRAFEEVERKNSENESRRAQSIPENQLDNANVDLGAYAGQAGLLAVAGLAMGAFGGDDDDKDKSEEQEGSSAETESSSTETVSTNADAAASPDISVTTTLPDIANSTLPTSEEEQETDLATNTSPTDESIDEVFPDVEVYFFSDEELESFLQNGWTLELSSLDEQAIKKILDPNCIQESGSQSGSSTDLQLILDSAGAESNE